MLTKVPNDTATRIRAGLALPELLCPAGSYEALLAAIEGGADAIYLGGTAFNARANAKNLTREEMAKGIALAHAYGIKVYIAANTLIYDLELDAFLREAEFAHSCGADALIVADIGAAKEISRRIPIELHASTQMSVHNADAANALSDAGFSRIVCAMHSLIGATINDLTDLPEEALILAADEEGREIISQGRKNKHFKLVTKPADLDMNLRQNILTRKVDDIFTLANGKLSASEYIKKQPYISLLL